MTVTDTDTDTDTAGTAEATGAPQEREHAARARIGAALRGTARRPWLLLAALYLGLVLAWTVAPGVFAHQDPLLTDASRGLRPPGAEHWFGTDNLGRDLYSRVVHGTRTSLVAGLLAVALALVVGSVLGALAGYLGGWIDQVLMRVVEVLIIIPGLLLSLAVVSILGFGTTNVAIAVGIAGIPGFARVVRAEVLRIKGSAYVQAAVTSGRRTPAILLRHIVPNASPPVLVLAALDIGGAVLSIAALSFLGYGAAPPAPELGAMVSQGRDYMSTAWWLTTFPGLTIALVVLSTSRIARALERSGVSS
ncbi:ABC transporter permease [Streptomyces radicis]|uniref:ABC transporter permease n=1 Tax=Streptomyces radicis TaxID=1750517 RepID=A0A3A9W6U0_9ACTN|nr:ABC transporter permease [Streptomyces radicis]RKN08432.1 ABC transporter permease [Streptomyces radicis]RKN21658.1 ABC transporter permease [Streptomyces radicis]